METETPEIFVNRSKNLLNLISKYFTIYYKEKIVPQNLFKKTIIAFLDIIETFKNLLDKINIVVPFPVEDTRIIPVVFNYFSELILKPEKFTVQILHKTVKVINAILNLWERFNNENGIDRFV